MASAFNMSACPAGHFLSGSVAMIAAAAAIGTAFGATVGLVAARGSFSLQCAAPRVHVQQGTSFSSESK